MKIEKDSSLLSVCERRWESSSRVVPKLHLKCVFLFVFCEEWVVSSIEPAFLFRKYHQVDAWILVG